MYATDYQPTEIRTKNVWGLHIDYVIVAACSEVGGFEESYNNKKVSN